MTTGLDQINKKDQLLIGTASMLGVALIAFMFPNPYVLVIAALLPLVVVLILYYPFVACLMLIVFSCFRLHEAFPILYPAKIPLFAALATILGAIWHIGLRRTAKPFLSPEILFLGLFFLTLVGGIALGGDRWVSLDFVFSKFWKIALAAVLIAWLASKPEDFLLTSRAFLISGILLSAVAVSNYLTGTDIEFGRVTIAPDLESQLGDPNDLAFTLMLPAGFAAAAFIHRSSMTSLLVSALAIGLIVVAVGLTKSRGGLLGLGVVLAVTALWLPRYRVLLFSCGFVGAIAMAIVFGFLNRSDFQGAQGLDLSALERLYAWRAAIRMALHYPIFGIGADNYINYFHVFAERWDNFRALTAHSTWFLVLAETGFIGLAMFVAMIGAAVRSTLTCIAVLARADAPIQLRAFALGLLGSIAGYCAAGSFLSQYASWNIYLLVALAAGLRHYVGVTYPSFFISKTKPDTAGKSQARSPQPGPFGSIVSGRTGPQG